MTHDEAWYAGMAVSWRGGAPFGIIRNRIYEYMRNGSSGSRTRPCFPVTPYHIRAIFLRHRIWYPNVDIPKPTQHPFATAHRNAANVSISKDGSHSQRRLCYKKLGSPVPHLSASATRAHTRLLTPIFFHESKIAEQSRLFPPIHISNDVLGISAPSPRGGLGAISRYSEPRSPASKRATMQQRRCDESAAE